MIVVCGEALIDVIRRNDGTERAVPGGSPVNTARALGRLGVPAAFLGRLSSDSFGRQIIEQLLADGVDVSLTPVGAEPATRAIAEVDAHGVARYRFEVDGTSAPNLTPEMLPVELGHDVIAISTGSLGLILEPMASTLVGLIARQGASRFVMLDPNVRLGLGDEAVYHRRLLSLINRCTVVKASDGDLAWLYPQGDCEDAAREILAQGVSLVAVTLGEHGAFGAHRGLTVHVDAPPVEVIDTIGAGDAFSAGLLAWLHDHDLLRPELELDEDRLRAALSHACLVASLTCARAGADPPWKREVDASTREFGIAAE